MSAAKDDEPACTTKYVTGTFTATFYGDYIDADAVVQHLDGWLDSGLDDRDDLRSWTFTFNPEVREVTGDPEGYDS